VGNGIQWIHGYMLTDQQTALSPGSNADPHKRRPHIPAPAETQKAPGERWEGLLYVMVCVPVCRPFPTKRCSLPRPANPRE